MTDLLDFVPALRTDFLRREVDGETVVWSPLAAEPVVLDPVATVMLDVIDGEASVGQLASEVHEEVGVELRRRPEPGRADGRAVWPSRASHRIDIDHDGCGRAIADRELFVNPCTSCMENAARGMTSLNLRFGDQTVGVACDSRRGVRKLRAALPDHVEESDGDVPVGFVLGAPVGLDRSHQLMDRSGLVHSKGRGLDAGLHALASHLTALLPLEPGTVRVRAGAVAAGDRTVVCLFPLLLVPRIEEAELAGAGYDRIDRLALDIDVATGRIVNPPIPWPGLTALGPAAGHLGPGRPGEVTAVVSRRIHRFAAARSGGSGRHTGEWCAARNARGHPRRGDPSRQRC